MSKEVYACQMCGSEDHQYLNAMEHAEHTTAYMCHDCVRKVMLRPQSWLAQTWERSKGKGNEYTNAGGFNTVIFQRRDGGWGARIIEKPFWVPGGYGYADEEEDEPIFVNAPTRDGAKLAALEVLLPLIKEKDRRWEAWLKENHRQHEEFLAENAAAETWMRQYLADGGNNNIYAEGAKAGHSDNAITIAQGNLDIRFRRDGTGYCLSPGIGQGTPEEMAGPSKRRKKRAEREERRKGG